MAGKRLIISIMFIFLMVSSYCFENISYVGEINYQKSYEFDNIAIDSIGRLYLAQKGKKSILVYNKFGSQIDSIHLQGNDYFAKGGDFIVDKFCNVIVVDTGKNYIKKFSPDGSILFTIGGKRTASESLRTPKGLALDENLNVYVADTGNVKIQFFNTDGIYVGAILSGDKIGAKTTDFRLVQSERYTGTPITKFPVLKAPVALAYSNGLLFVLDSMTRFVVIYNRQGEYMGSIDLNTVRGIKDIMPIDIAVFDEKVFILDSKYNNIKIFNLKGKFLQELGIKGTGRGEFYKPQAIFMMENVLYVLDTGNNRVQMFQYGSSSEKKRDENKMVPSERPKVAIFDLENSNKEAIDKLMGGAVSEMLTTNFVKSNRFEIVERKELNKILDEQHFNSSGFVSADSAKEIGKLLGIDIGIVGSVSTLTDKIDIDVRMLDMKTGVVILATNKSVKNENKIRDAVSEIVMELERSYINRIGAPSAPTGVISLPSMKSLYIKWDPNPEEDVIGYNIFSSTSAEAKFEKVAEVNKNEYKVDGLNENSTYLFKITAFDSEGKESEFSDLVSVNTKKSPDFGYILNIKYKKLPKKVDFSWTNPEEEIVSSYQIYRAETSDGDYKLVGTSIEKKFEETGLEDGKEYFYKIKKVYPDGLASAFSNYFCCMTDESPNEIQDINAVSNLAKKIEITWKIPETDKDISKIYIFRSDVSGGEFKMINDVTSLRKKYVDNKLNDNTTYYYKLKSVDKFGLESVFSREILATTKDVPATPTNLFAESNLARKVKLTWEYNFMNDQKVYFLVFRASTMNEEFKEIAKLDKTEYIDQKLPDNKQFFYFVTARDTDDLASNPTDIIQAKTKPLPTKPSTLKAMERQPRKVSLVWDKNPEPDIDHYKVYKSKKSQTWYKSIADVKETTYTDDEEKKGLRDNTSYFYKISAVDVDNLESEQSDEISAITKALPSIPKDVVVVDNNEQGIAISWPPVPGDDVFGYVIYKNKKRIEIVKSNLYADTNIIAGVGYTYEVATLDNDQLESDKSQAVKFKREKPKE